MKKTIKPYVLGILISLGVGALSALSTSGNMDIYDRIVKPPLAPPGILFPIVWTVLYILMGISSALIYNTRTATASQRNNAFIIYGLQLAVNFFWSIIFFNFEAYLLAFIWILLLWCLILLMIIKFSQINKIAAILQIPYFLWVTFAGYLNLMIYILNR